jgi:hypothetical protein
MEGVAKSLVRVKVYRPRTPFFLRPEVWLVFAGICYFTFEKATFYGPLAYEQNFPRGLVRGLSSRFEGLLNENGVGKQTWAIPVNDFQKSNGLCLRVIPGPEDAPERTSLGGPITFSAPLATEDGAGAIDPTYVCQQEKADKFFVTVEGKSVARLERGYGLPLGLEVEEGSAHVKALPGAELELLLPNGLLTLRAPKGFEARVKRGDGLLSFVVKEGLAEAEPQFTPNYRAESLGLELSAEGKGKLRLPNRAPAGAGKTFRAVPSGIYAETK